MMMISIQQVILIVSAILLSRSVIVSGFVPSTSTSIIEESFRSSIVLRSSMSGMPYESSSPSSPIQSSLEEQILSIATMDDESKRRADFESFVIQQIQAEQQQKIYIKISDLSFVKDLTDCLTRLGHAVQNGEKHVVSRFVDIPGFQLEQQQQQKNAVTDFVKTSGIQQAQLWTFVDLLIQFKALVQKRTEEKGATKKEQRCGRCEVCKCGKKI